MYELNAFDADNVTGGSMSSFFSWVGWGMRAFETWGTVMSGFGGTLSNYYGPETTLEIINGGNLGA